MHERAFNKTVKRKICVISPLRLVIENVEESFSEECSVRNHPQDKSLGERIVQFGKNLYIERSDFQVNPAKDFFRLRAWWPCKTQICLCC